VEKQSTWRVGELVRELAAAVPTNLGIAAGTLTPWLDDVAGKVIATRTVDLSHPIPKGAPLRRDGRPTTEAAVDRVLTLPGILAQEERLLALAERRLKAGGADRQIESGADLNKPQLALAEAIAGDRALVLAVGPAGTGKTTALRPAVDQLRREGRPVFGVAPSAAAAEVLAIDAGTDSDTIDKLLVEHRLDRPPDHRYDLPAGSTVIVDETAMVPTPRLAELMELAERRRWRLAMIGDPLQFAAVGRSGMFGHFVDTFGAIELGRVHRFNHDWERDASLRLRRGDATVIDTYEKEDRLHGGTARQMRKAVIDRWRAALERGESASMMAPTNAAVVALNVEAQRRRLEAGDLAPTGRSLELGPYRIHREDLVATRQNARQLVTDRHVMVKNRDRWTVEAVHRDGSLTMTGKSGTVKLPADYVREHVELAYAETSHANQGRTVDRSLLYLDGPTGASGIYVPMTRGRESNDAFVVIRGEETPADVIAEALSRTWIDRPAVAVRAEMRTTADRSDGDRRQRAPDRALAPKELRRLLERHAELDSKIAQAPAALDAARARVRMLANQQDAVRQSIEDYRARLVGAREKLAELDRPMLRRRHRTEIARARSEVTAMPGSIEEAQAKLVALDHQVPHASRRVGQAEATVVDLQELRAERALLGQALDRDAGLRGRDAAGVLPAVVMDRLGPSPARGPERNLWVDTAGKLAQHHVAFELHGTTLVGPTPRPFGQDAYATSYWAAVRAVERLDRALGRQPEIEPPSRSLGRSL
jgi:predicted  nucleic acid-binding Zn-ribbon protein